MNVTKSAFSFNSSEHEISKLPHQRFLSCTLEKLKESNCPRI